MNADNSEPRPVEEVVKPVAKTEDYPGLLRCSRASYLLAAAMCAVLWLGLLGLFLAWPKYSPYSTNMVVGPEPESYDAFIENRRIAKKLKAPLESGTCTATLVIIGAWAAFCGWRLGKNAGKQVILARGLMGIGCATVAVGLLVFPFIVARGSSARNACINVLRQIDGSKEQWAMENKKTAADTPTWRDLMGKDKYIKTMPECPGGGRFTINSMTTKPKCSVPEHTFD